MTELMPPERMAMPPIPAVDHDFLAPRLDRLVRALKLSTYPEQMAALAMHEIMLRLSGADLSMRHRILDYITRANVRDFS
jgi:hypothetical protein